MLTYTCNYCKKEYEVVENEQTSGSKFVYGDKGGGIALRKPFNSSLSPCFSCIDESRKAADEKLSEIRKKHE